MPCRKLWFTADGALGIKGMRYSHGAIRMITLAAGTCSFERASLLLEEMSGMDVSPNTVEKIACMTGEEIQKWTQESTELHEKFANSKGACELMLDGTCVNTLEGWKEVRLWMMAHILSGETRTYATLDKGFPAATMKLGYAQIESSESFLSHFPDWKKRLRIYKQWETYITADGAPWIWKGMEEHFWNSHHLLDFYHASEHIHASMKECFPKDVSKQNEWNERLCLSLLQRGWPGLEQELQSLKDSLTNYRWKKHVQRLEQYFTRLCDKLDYPTRLLQGRTIGSGMIEGACKQIVNTRVKKTGARWAIPNINRLLHVLTMLHCSTWKMYWNQS